MDIPTKTRAASTRARRPKIAPGKEAWLKAARESLVKEGIASVQIGKLARRLRVTRSTFYWFFTNRKQLQDLLQADWEETNTAAFDAILRLDGTSGIEKFLAMGEIWIDEKGFSSQWDSAMRDWARTSPKVAVAVRRVDNARIDIIKQVFLEMGCTDADAFVRARISYFHQVGYYILGVKETRKERLELMPFYVRILTGHSIE